MDKRDEIQSDAAPKKGGNLINRNGLVFAFFLLLSFIFWYLNSLGKDLETDIRYPVKYVSIPKNRELKENLPQKLTLFMTGPGYSILRLKITGSADPLIIDFSKISYLRRRDVKSNEYYIITSGLVSEFNSQLKSSCRITAVLPDTLYFSFRQASE